MLQIVKTNTIQKTLHILNGNESIEEITRLVNTLRETYKDEDCEINIKFDKEV